MAFAVALDLDVAQGVLNDISQKPEHHQKAHSQSGAQRLTVDLDTWKLSLFAVFFFLNGSFSAFVGRPLERDGFWMMAVRLCEVKMWSEKEGKGGLLFAICLETSQN